MSLAFIRGGVIGLGAALIMAGCSDPPVVTADATIDLTVVDDGASEAAPPPPPVDAASPPEPAEVRVGDPTPVPLVPPYEPAPRDRKRMNIDQLWATVDRVTGGVHWIDATGEDALVEKASLLGKPDFVDTTQEVDEPDLLFDKQLGDLARSVCVELMAKEQGSAPGDRVFLVHAAPTDTSSSAPSAIAENMRRVLLRFHGTYLTADSPELAPWLGLFDQLSQTDAPAPDPIQGWTGICVTLMSHPNFFTY